MSDNSTQTVVSPPHNQQYIVAIVVMAFLSVSAVVAVTIFRPHEDNATIITTIVGLTMPTTLSLLAFMKAQETHLSVNSRLDAFMLNAKEASHAQGLVQGRQEGRDLADARTDAIAKVGPRHARHTDPVPRPPGGVLQVEAPVLVIAPTKEK